MPSTNIHESLADEMSGFQPYIILFSDYFRNVLSGIKQKQNCFLLPDIHIINVFYDTLDLSFP